MQHIFLHSGHLDRHRKGTGETNFVKDGSVPVIVPTSHASERACSVP